MVNYLSAISYFNEKRCRRRVLKTIDFMMRNSLYYNILMESNWRVNIIIMIKRVKLTIIKYLSLTHVKIN